MVKTLSPESYVDVFYVGRDYRKGDAVVLDLAGIAAQYAEPA